MGKIYNISKKIDFNNVTYEYKDKGLTPINFVGFRGLLNIYENTKNGNKSIAKEKKIKDNLN